MKNSLLIAAIGLLAEGVSAGYLVSSNGEVARNSYGECWHTGSWTPDDAIVGCDGVVAEVPVVVVVPTPVEPVKPPVKQLERVTLDAETYFAFDKASLKPGAVDKLDRLIGEIKASEGVDRILVTGHADRIGAADYNQALSERRARSVRDYLVDRIGSADRIETLGKGESQPIAACPNLAGDRLITCLAPNRRVDVDASVSVRQ
jgi:OOP family OmpA-OmpF porin